MFIPNCIEGLCSVTFVGSLGMPQRGLIRTACCYTDARTVRSLHPQNIFLSSMAATQDEHRELSLNSCVDGHYPVTFLIVTHYSSQGPSASQNAGRGCVSPFCCTTTLDQDPSLNSIQIAKSQGSRSQLRVEVTSMYLIPNSLMPRKLFIVFVSPPSAKYSPYQETV